MDFLLRNSTHLDFTGYILLTCLTLLVLIKKAYNQQFNEFLGFLFNGKYLLLHNKAEQKDNYFNSLFFVFFILNLGLYLYSASTLPLFKNFTYQPLSLYTSICTLTCVILLGRYLLEKIVFEILNLQLVLRSYHFQRITFTNFIAIALFIANILFYFSSLKNTTNLIYIFFFISLFIYLFSLAFIIAANRKIILTYWFYFILYLCAFEISPILLGGMLLKTNL